MFSTSPVCNMSAWLSSSILVFFFSLFTPLSRAELNVAAASDLSLVGPELQRQFEVKHPTIHIKTVFGSSAMLMQQIRQGAPFDVFLSANAQFVDELGESGKLYSASIRPYAVGRLGLVWRDGQRHPIRELGTHHMRVLALPNPKLAPYGVAAQQALEYGGIWLTVQPKVVYGENVRQTLQFLESGNADAAITSDSLLQGKNAEVLPAEWHKPIIQKAGIVSGTANRDAARKFLDFLLGPEGQAVFARFGFSPPPIEPR